MDSLRSNSSTQSETKNNISNIETDIRIRDWINPILTKVFDGTNNEKEFINVLENNFEKLFGHLIMKELGLDKDILNLTEEERQDKQFKKIYKKYELFRITDDEGKHLYYDNGMPVIDFRYVCHDAENVYNEYGLRNWHIVDNWIATNATQDKIFLPFKSISDTGVGKLESGGGHQGLRNTIDTLIDELFSEIGLQPEQYKSELLTNTITISNKTQNQVCFMHNVIITDPNYQPSYKDGEASKGRFYTIDEVIKILEGEITIDGKSMKIDFVEHQRTNLLDYLYKKGHINLDKYMILKQKFDTKDKSKLIEITSSTQNDLFETLTDQEKK